LFFIKLRVTFTRNSIDFIKIKNKQQNTSQDINNIGMKLIYWLSYKA